MCRIRKIDDFLPAYARKNFSVRILLIVSVRNNIGDDHFILNNKCHITRKNLIVVFDKVRVVNFYTVFDEDFLELGHFINDVFFIRINSVLYRMVRFCVVTVFQRVSGTHRIGHAKNY